MRKEINKLLDKLNIVDTNPAGFLKQILQAFRSDLLECGISWELRKVEDDDYYAHGCLLGEPGNEQAVWDSGEFGNNLSSYVHEIMSEAERKISVLENILTALEDMDISDEEGYAEVIINKKASMNEGFKLTVKE